MIFKRIVPSFLFLALALNISFSQKLVSTEYITSYTKSELNTLFGVVIIQNGVDLYKVLYETDDIHGVLDTASGLMLIPDVPENAYPLMINQHGTVDNRWDVPSNLQGGYQLPLIYSGMGYVTAAPDYLGLGEARGIHPYVHAESQAWAAIDMLFAVKEYASENGVLINDQLFITGYSQGGHAAMAAHKTIERDYADVFTVTAAAPMSGPYSLSEKMFEFTFGDQEYGTVAYLVSLSLSYQEAYGNIFENGEFSSLFKPQYIPLIEKFINEEIGLFDMNDQIMDLLVEDVGGSIPKFMFKDEVREAILTDPNHPIIVALRDNDNHDWTPVAPMRMYYCTEDEQVFFENALFAEETMLANGAKNVSTRNSGALTHSGCVFPSVTNAILWFAGFKDQTSDVNDIDLGEIVEVFPNPSDGQFQLKFNDNGNWKIELYDVYGRLIMEDQIENESYYKLNLEIHPGQYILKTNNGNISKTTQLILR